MCSSDLFILSHDAVRDAGGDPVELLEHFGKGIVGVMTGADLANVGTEGRVKVHPSSPKEKKINPRRKRRKEEKNTYMKLC